MKKFIFRTLALINMMVILMMLMVGYSGKLDPMEHSLLSSVGLFFPIFLIANFILLVIWIFFHWKWAWLPLLGFLLCFVPVRQYIPFNPPASPPEGAIKVLSYNVMGFDLGHATENEVNQIAEYIAASKASLVCLQESRTDRRYGRKIDTLLQSVYPYYELTDHPGKSPDHLSLYSKYPILSKEMISFRSNQNFSMAYVVKINGERVLVVNNHLESTKLSYGDKGVFEKMTHGNLSKDSVEKESMMIFGKLAESLKSRAPQADSVAAYIQKHLEKGMSVIVCGDFNDNPLSYTRQKIAENLTDCYIASGNGPGFSYHFNRMYVRIDNILCSDDWKPYACHIDRQVAQSDHYPIICWLKKRPKP